MTPAELSLVCDAHIARKKAEQEAANSNIYNLAGLIRMAVWGKKMPKYDSIFEPEKEKKEKKAMSDDEIFAAVCALNLAFGGKVIQ